MLQNMVKCTKYTIVLAEVPNEVSIGFNITGCPHKCKNCHSPELQNENNGEYLSDQLITNIISKYNNFVSCVCFFGGEWKQNWLIDKLNIIKNNFKLKTCLYTGLDKLPNEILNNLDYVKYGRYIEEFGGLSSKFTNQKFFHIPTNSLLNHLFIKESM